MNHPEPDSVSRQAPLELPICYGPMFLTYHKPRVYLEDDTGNYLDLNILISISASSCIYIYIP